MAIKSSSHIVTDNDGLRIFSGETYIERDGYNSKLLKKDYDNHLPQFELLRHNLVFILKQLILNSDIKNINIDSRVKDFNSFWGKCLVKKYKKPFSEMPDVCGIRITCNYLSEVSLVKELIKKEFVIKETVDRQNIVYGYNSTHYIISLKPTWLKIPLFKNLKNVKAEVQLRTVLMNTWMEISRHYVYKNENNIPENLKTKLNAISTEINSIDKDLDILKIEVSKYPIKPIKEVYFSYNKE